MACMIEYCRIFSYLDVLALCRCAQVSKFWNVLALDGSNWQHVDLFAFQRDIEVSSLYFSKFLFCTPSLYIWICSCINILAAANYEYNS